MSKAFLLWGVVVVFLLQLAPSAAAPCQNCIKEELVLSSPLLLLQTSPEGSGPASGSRTSPA